MSVRTCMCMHCYCALITVEQRKEPIPLKNFSEHVANMHKDRDLGFEEEYSVCSIIYIIIASTIFLF